MVMHATHGDFLGSGHSGSSASPGTKKPNAVVVNDGSEAWEGHCGLHNAKPPTGIMFHLGQSYGGVGVGGHLHGENIPNAHHEVTAKTEFPGGR